MPGCSQRRGRKMADLAKLSIEELAGLFPARQRRSIKRGLAKENKNLLANLKNKDSVRTHIRNMLILPDMVGKNIEIYNGKSFEKVEVMPEMIGHFFGEFAMNALQGPWGWSFTSHQSMPARSAGR